MWSAKHHLEPVVFYEVTMWTSFWEEGVANYAHAYDTKVILLLEMAVTHDRTAGSFQ